jgi:hypothetical protein
MISVHIMEYAVAGGARLEDSEIFCVKPKVIPFPNQT